MSAVATNCRTLTRFMHGSYAIGHERAYSLLFHCNIVSIYHGMWLGFLKIWKVSFLFKTHEDANVDQSSLTWPLDLSSPPEHKITVLMQCVESLQTQTEM